MTSITLWLFVASHVILSSQILYVREPSYLLNHREVHVVLSPMNKVCVFFYVDDKNVKEVTNYSIHAGNNDLLEYGVLNEVKTVVKGLFYFETKVVLTHVLAQESKLQSYHPYNQTCLVKAVIYDNKGIAQFGCLKTRPLWMEEEMDTIYPMYFYRMAWPGTANSFTYYTPIRNYNARESFWRRQTISVYDQLRMGIRALDLSVGVQRSVKEGTTESVFTCQYRGLKNNTRHIHMLRKVLPQVKRFLDETYQEIIVLIVRFAKKLHDTEEASLMTIMKQTFGDYLYDGTNFTQLCYTQIGDLIKQGKRLVMLTPCDDVNFQHTKILRIKEILPTNEDTPQTYQKVMLNDAREQFFNNKINALRLQDPHFDDKFAKRTEPFYFTRVLEEITWNRRIFQFLTNILLVDFFQSTSVVDFSIRVNRQKSGGMYEF